MLRFTLFGIPVSIDPWFWLIGLLFGGSRLDLGRNVGTILLVIWMVIWLVSFLVHEFGHAAFQRMYGGRPEILLYGGGGLAFGNGRFTRWQDLVISAAGPCVEIAVGVAALMALTTFEPANYFVRHALADFSWICIVWGAFNLIPMLPLDGGHIANAVSGGKTRLVAGIGMVCGAATALFLLLQGLIFVAIYFGYFAWRNFRTWQRGYRSESPMGEI